MTVVCTIQKPKVPLFVMDISKGVSENGDSLLMT